MESWLSGKRYQQLVRLAEFMRYVLQRFQRNEGLESAAFLTYTSLLSLVPLLAVILATVSVFPVFQQWSGDIQDFVFSNFVPAVSDIIQQNIDAFVRKANRMTAAGIIFLVLTALILMSNIERQLNRIFSVRQKRTLRGRLMVYWTALSLGPLMLGASFAISSYILSLPLIRDAAEGLGGPGALLRLAPVLVSSTAFTLLFIVVPNRSVRWRHGFAGGIVAGVLLELAKIGFALYVTHFPTYDAIYGALASIPIFLVWVYLSWVIILFGATISAALAEPPASSRLEVKRAPSLQRRLMVLYPLWQAHNKGETLSESALAKESGMEISQLSRDLQWLNRNHLANRSENEQWQLAINPASISLAEMVRKNGEDSHFYLAKLENPQQWQQYLLNKLPCIHESEQLKMISLQDLFNQPKKTTT